MSDEQIKRMIRQKYSSENVKIADLCLELGTNWTKVVGKDFEKMPRAKAKKDCVNYIRNNFDRSKVKSSILVTLFLSVIVKLIANWIADMIINKNKHPR